MDHEHVISEVVAWAEAEDNVRLVVLVGSVGRGDAEVDELSDLDVQLYVTEPGRLLADPTWHERFGEILVVEHLPNPGWYPTRLCYYVDAKIDFIVTPTSDIGVDTYDEPFRVLCDKDHVAERLLLVPPEHTLPDEAEFSEGVNWFYAAAIMAARAVVRDEPWLAKNRDFDAKQELLKMIEWDHRSRYGTDYHTWFLGKHLDQWMDPATCAKSSTGAGEHSRLPTPVPPWSPPSSCTTASRAGRPIRSGCCGRRSTGRGPRSPGSSGSCLAIVLGRRGVRRLGGWRSHGARLAYGRGDRVGAAGHVPADLEDHGQAADAQEDGLLVPADEAATERRLHEREHPEDQPSRAGDEAVGVAAAPVVERAPTAGRQAGHTVKREGGLDRQVRGGVEQGDDNDYDAERGGVAEPDPVHPSLDVRVGGQRRRGPTTQRAPSAALVGSGGIATLSDAHREPPTCAGPAAGCERPGRRQRSGREWERRSGTRHLIQGDSRRSRRRR